MGENIQYKRFLPLVILAMSILLQGCKDDVFNPEKVKAAYQDRFPVKNIDPAMDWKMTQQVRVNVSVSEDTGIDYTIRIYDKNPLISRSSAKLLAEGTANNTTVFTTVMDCPSVLTSAFVCRTDAHSRNIVKYVSIQNGQLHAAFGSSPTTTRAAWTRSVSIETYSPEKSEAEITAMLSSAEEIRPNTDFQNGKAYKISKDNIYRNKISKDGMGSDNPAIIIIEGSWEPNGNNMTDERGFEFYVIDGGEIVIPDEHTFTLVQSSRFIVYAGGTIKGNDIELTNASGGSYNYNAGTMEIDDFHVSQGVDSYAYFTNFAFSHRIGGIITDLGRQVECAGQAGTTVSQQVTITFVGFFSGGETSVHTHGPETATIHGRLNTTGVRIFTREAQFSHVVKVFTKIYRGVQSVRNQVCAFREFCQFSFNFSMIFL